MNEEVVARNVSARGVKGSTGIRHDGKLVVSSVNLDATDMNLRVISNSLKSNDFSNVILDGIVNRDSAIEEVTSIELVYKETVK